MDLNKKSRKDYEKYLNSISPDRDDEAWIIGGKNRYCGRENYGTMINRYENDLLTAGCHRIAYNEMERIAKQLGWV